MKKIKSFTLAEVLITLVVIGIIAAVTVPVVMANHKKTETSVKLKKFYANLSNAVKLSEVNEGIPVSDWDFSLDHKQFFYKYLAQYINYTKIEEGTGSEGSGIYVIYLDDGTLIRLDGDNSSYKSYLFDVNGEKTPNFVGRDIFDFEIYNNEFYGNRGASVVDTWRCNSPEGGECTREEILAEINMDIQWPCYICSSLLQIDGWEFKDDYPYKL